MGLSKKERLSLANQFKILSGQNPTQSDHYNDLATILEQGIKSEYKRVFASIKEEVSLSDCTEVTETLAMYEALQSSFDKVKTQTTLTEEEVSFTGYANTPAEAGLDAQAGFLIKSYKKNIRTSQSKTLTDPRSHYFKMNKIWTSLGKKQDLSEEEVKLIIKAY